MNRQPHSHSPFTKCFLVLGLLAGMAIPGLGHGMTLTVTESGDGADANPDDGKCATDLGLCTLRAAIQVTNASDGPDTIDLKNIVNLNISGAFEDSGKTGDLDITDDLTIQGDIVRNVSAGGTSDRVFHIQNGAVVKLVNLKITGGNLQSSTAPKGHLPGGGGILVQGSSTLTLENVNLTYNNLYGSSTFELTGGGLYVDSLATVYIKNSEITHNTGPGSGGIANLGYTEIKDTLIDENNGGSAYGGGIRNLGGYLHIGNSVISNNKAQHGGALYSSDLGQNLGNVIISNTKIDKNRATNFGGGIFNEGPLTLVNSTVSNNDATGRGGGINNSALGNIEIINSTITGNEAITDSQGRSGGGGIYNGRSITLTNVTLYNNRATLCSESGCTADGAVGGNQLAVFGDAPTVTVVNTIIANGMDSSGTTTACAGAAGYTSLIHSSGGNLEDGNSCALIANTDLTNKDEGLDLLTADSPLTTGTGITPHHPLTAGSQAINHGVAGCPTVDQRFMMRDTQCDIGAYEYGATVSQPDSLVDLKVTISDNVDPVKPNDTLVPLTYTVAVSNLYVNDSSGFDVQIQLPINFKTSLNGITSSSASGALAPDCPETPDPGNKVTCYLNTLPGLGRVEIFVTGYPTVDKEPITADAGTVGVTNDAFYANNYDSEETTVDSDASSGIDNYGGTSLKGGGGGALHPLWLLTLGGLWLARRRLRHH